VKTSYEEANMDLVRWRTNRYDPADEFDRLRNEINALFDVPGFMDSQGIFDRSISPALDVAETDDEIIVTCDLPGLKDKDIEVSVASGVLTIKGEKKATEPKEGTRIYRRETWSGSFQRTVALPPTADTEKVAAHFADGVLSVSIPRKEETKPKKIELKVK
jgi:HSP20 family protein